MNAFDSTEGRNGSTFEMKREKGLDANNFSFGHSTGEIGTIPEMKSEKGLDANNFFFDQSTVGESSTIPEMKSEKQFPSPSLYPKQFFPDLVTSGVVAALAKTVTMPTETILRKSGADLVRSSIASIYWRPESAGVIARFVPMQALSFAFKEFWRIYFIESLGLDPKKDLFKTAGINFISGGIGGVLSLGLLYPLDLARARLGADVGRAGYMNKGLLDCLIKIAKTDGRQGLYKGFVLNHMPVYVYHLCFYGIFDTAKMVCTRDGKEFGPGACLASAMMAWYCAINVSNVWWRVRERSLKRLQLKDVFFKGSLSGTYRSSGMSIVLFILVLETMRND